MTTTISLKPGDRIMVHGKPVIVFDTLPISKNYSLIVSHNVKDELVTTSARNDESWAAA